MAKTGVEQTQVLIIGAGPAGLTLGCELARRGVDFVLAEKDAGPFTGSRGKGLQPRTQEIFADLGVLDEVRAHGGLYPPLQVRQNGQVVHEGRMDPLREVTPDVPYPNVWMLPQWRTGDVLRARLAELGGCVRYGTELMSFDQDADGLTAVLRRGNESVTVRARYLAGADGGHSAVRQSLGIGFAGETREEQRMIVADVLADGVSRDYWHIWTAADGGPAAFRLGLCPLAGTESFQLTAPVLDRPAAEAAAPDLTRDGLQLVADAAAGPGRVRIETVTWASLYRTNIRMAERFRAGRAFLAGDAAHVHSPAGGQGLNTSIQDAYNLGWKLAAVLAGAPAALLDSYEEERLPVAASVLGISTRLHDKAVEAGEDAHRRDDPELRQLQLGYRHSPLTRELRPNPGPLVAGDRAPDAPGRDGCGRAASLFSLTQGGAVTLLSFGPGADQVAAGLAAGRPGPVRAVAVRAQPAGLHDVPAGSDGPPLPGAGPPLPGAGPAGPAGPRTFFDTGGHARQAYGVGDGQDVLFAIRPDGYLGFGADQSPALADQAAEYLAEICPPA
jgi:2-polyprenyl-6-methoxyphenol hydroxylase-like FAD-dependent oxidoreductase